MIQKFARYILRRRKTGPHHLIGYSALILLCCPGCRSIADGLPETLSAKGTSTSLGLRVAYGIHGLEKLTWRGTVFADVNKYPNDAMHIWHMAAVGSNGKPRTGPKDGWGENNEGKSWDEASKTWTYRFVWGRIRVQYHQSGDELNVKVTEENDPDSGISFEGASVYPLVLHLAGAQRAAPLADNLTTPGITVLPFTAGTVTVTTPAERNQLYSGCEQSSADASHATCSIVVSSVIPDSMNNAQRLFLEGRRPPVLPGQSNTFQLSLHFFPPDTPLSEEVKAAARSWSTRWPATLTWTDRRPIGTVYLASSPQQGMPRLASDPRRYFVTDKIPDIDIQTPAGLKLFQLRMLDAAKAVAAHLTRLEAQGAIVWDIEGEEYPQLASYVCSPDQIGNVAPEMESKIDDRSSRYFGLKLSDAYFKVIRDAGFRVGVCIRPQQFSVGPDHTARQESLPPDQVTSQLVRKMRYAHQRWGATLFYLDSTVDADGRTLDPSIIEKAASAMPDSLIIPEESSLRMYRATAPFGTFLFHGDIGTSDLIRSILPYAFSVNMINDADPARLEAHREKLQKSVRDGDILMVHADDWPPANDFVKQLYQAAQPEHR